MNFTMLLLVVQLRKLFVAKAAFVRLLLFVGIDMVLQCAISFIRLKTLYAFKWSELLMEAANVLL